MLQPNDANAVETASGIFRALQKRSSEIATMQSVLLVNAGLGSCFML